MAPEITAVLGGTVTFHDVAPGTRFTIEAPDDEPLPFATAGETPEASARCDESQAPARTVVLSIDTTEFEAGLADLEERLRAFAGRVDEQMARLRGARRDGVYGAFDGRSVEPQFAELKVSEPVPEAKEIHVSVLVPIARY